MKAAFVATVLWSLGATEALPETVPLRGIADSRVRTAVYDANEVYRLHGFVGYEIDLQFEVGESFVGLGADDIRRIVALRDVVVSRADGLADRSLVAR